MLNKIVADVINIIFSLVHNYGLAMIVFGLLLRFVLMPLDIRSRKSMRAMSAIQPKVNAINAKYANDPVLKNRKMQELYKAEKVSPMASCLPMLFQMPLMFLIFSAMRNYSLTAFSLPLVSAMESGNFGAVTEIFDSARFLWVQNIFAPDTLFGAYNRPFLMGETLLKVTANLPRGFVSVNELTTNVGPALGAQIGVAGSTFTSGYDAVRWSYLAQPDVIGSKLNTIVNGLFILPPLSGALQFLQGWLGQRAQKKTQTAPLEGQGQGSMKMMIYLFPLMSVWLGATYSSMFTIYWITTSLCSIALQLVVDWRMDRMEKAKGEPGEATVRS